MTALLAAAAQEEADRDELRDAIRADDPFGGVAAELMADSAAAAAGDRQTQLSSPSSPPPSHAAAAALLPPSSAAPSIYDSEDDDARCLSQEEQSAPPAEPAAPLPPPPPPPRPPPRALPAGLNTSAGSSRSSHRPPQPPSSPLTLRTARSESWLSGGGEEESGAARGGAMLGFTSGSGRKVEISAAAMARAARLMQEIQDIQDEASEERIVSRTAAEAAGRASLSSDFCPPPSAFRTPTRPAAAALGSAVSASPFPGSAASSPPSAMLGFSTGSGRRVEVQAASLERGRQLMRQAEEEADRLVTGRERQRGGTQHLQPLRHQPPPPPPSSFKPPASIDAAVLPLLRPPPPPAAAAMASVAPHSKADHFDAWLAAQQDCDEPLDGAGDADESDALPPSVSSSTSTSSASSASLPSSPPAFCGFSTGKGAAVRVSDESVRKARLLLQSVDDDAHFPALVAARQTEKRRAAEQEQPAKRRRLVFRSPRPLSAAGGGSGQRKEAEASTPTLLRSAEKSRDAAPASLPPLRSFSPPPSFSPAADVLRFDLSQRRMERHTESELLTMGVAPAVVSMTSVSALRYTFPSSSSSSSRGPHDALHHLVQLGCDASLLSLQWVRNHYRWIVWKLASLERRFPSVLAGRCLSYYQLVKQLRHRYQREMENAQRSALRLILERDDSAARYLVLCVAAVFPAAVAADSAARLHDDADGGHVDAGLEGDEDEELSLLLHRGQQSATHLELTDGWYSVAARLDAGLLDHLRCGRIHAGSKLRIFNASLAGGSDAASPLENGSLHLELHCNSTRRAPAHHRLGFQRSAVFSVCLASLREDGGVVPCLQAVVSRVYPLLWMEKTEDGRKIHRTQRAEDAAQEEWTHGVISRAEEQQAAAAAAAARGDELTATLPDSCSAADQEPLPRTVFPYLKVRLHELVPAEAAPPLAVGEALRTDPAPRLLSGSECLLTVWKPSEADTEALREGRAITVFAAQMSGRYDGLLRLSSSRFAPILSHPALPPCIALQRRATAFSQLSLLRAGDEFDAVMVALVERRFALPAAGSGCGPQQTRQLFGCYDAEAALLVEVREDATAQRHFASLTAPLQLPLVLLALNLRYVRHDAPHHLHVAHATLSSALSTKGGAGEGGSRQRLARDWADCKAWAETAAAHEVERMQRQRLQRLVDGEQEAMTDDERERWLAQLRRRIADAATAAASASAAAAV